MGVSKVIYYKVSGLVSSKVKQRFRYIRITLQGEQGQRLKVKVQGEYICGICSRLSLFRLGLT